MFYYFLPITADQVTRESLSAGPLGPIFWDLLRSPALFESRIRTFPVHNHGPNGSSGVIVAAMPAQGMNGAPPGVRPGQSWIHVKQGNYWLGFEGDLPTPGELQREHTVAGVDAELGDGRIWLAPIVRRRGRNALPSRWGVNPATGDYEAQMLPRYAEAWEAASRIFDAAIWAEIDRLEVLQLCVQMLAVNYRVGIHEVSALGLFDDTTWKPVWRAAIDADFLEEWIAAQGDPQKKSG